MNSKTFKALKRLVDYANGYRNVDYPTRIDINTVEEWINRQLKEEDDN